MDFLRQVTALTDFVGLFFLLPLLPCAKFGGGAAANDQC